MRRWFSSEPIDWTRALTLVTAAGGLALSSGCGPGNWSVESESAKGSVTLLDGESEAKVVVVAETTHAGRINAFVTLPGVPTPPTDQDLDVAVPVDEFEQEASTGPLVVAELVLGDESSLIQLPGVGGRLSVRCPGARCEEEEGTLTLRVLDDADVPTGGLFLTWELRAETFGSGASTPADAEATLRVKP